MFSLENRTEKAEQQTGSHSKSFQTQRERRGGRNQIQTSVGDKEIARDLVWLRETSSCLDLASDLHYLSHSGILKHEAVRLTSNEVILFQNEAKLCSEIFIRKNLPGFNVSP